MIFVDFCASEMLRDTELLTLAEEGAYRRVWDKIIETDDRLPDDDERLAWLTKTGPSWPQIKQKLVELGKIVIEGGRITIRRCQELIRKAQRLIAQRAAAGAASAAQRRRTRTPGPRAPQRGGGAQTVEPGDDSTSVATSVAATHSLTNHDPPGGGSSPQIPPGGDGRAGPATFDTDFADWWDAYPRKVREAEARVEYARVRARGVAPAELAAGAERYAQALARPGAAKPMNPARWLTLERWRDQPELLLPIAGGDAYAANGAFGPRGRKSPHQTFADAGARIIAALQRAQDVPRGEGAVCDRGLGMAAAGG